MHNLFAPERFLESFREGFGNFRGSGEGAVVGKKNELAALTQIPLELSRSAARWDGGDCTSHPLVLDPQGQIMRLNHFMETITGYSLKMFESQNWFSTFLPEPIREITKKKFQDAIQNIQTRGNVTGLLAIGPDVTERKCVEAGLTGQIEEFRRWHAATLGREERIP